MFKKRNTRPARLLLFFVAAFLCGFAVANLDEEIGIDMVRKAGRLFGFHFSQNQLELMMPSVRVHMQSVEALREASVDNAVPPALVFDPVLPGIEMPVKGLESRWMIPDGGEMPENTGQLAFYSIPQLASLLRSRKVTSEQLTTFFLNRLHQYGDTLECVVTLTRDRALSHARRADAEIAAGQYRGPLHGIPYGVKDLFSVEGYPTSWGATPYKGQHLEHTATVVERLDEAGAVLVAKLTLGALAMGDVWYDGKTRNPWNLEEGSSGSSAGSASTVAAGLLPFAIGTETLGSIVSPSTRCGVTGLRPTFGRVSRTGAMTLSWSMDKIGPMARSAEETAMVFDAILGPDGKDKSVVDAGFYYEHDRDISQFRVGYISAFFEDDPGGKDPDHQVLADLRAMGLELHDVDWRFDSPVNALRIILHAEAAAAFDELTTTGRDSLLVNQSVNAWPNLFRAARFIPAVEYINANRARYQLMEEVNQLMAGYDVIITPSFGGNQLLVTNLTGHPCLVVPNGFTETGTPRSISFIGNLFEEDKIMALASAWQKKTGHHKQRPPFFDPSLH